MAAKNFSNLGKILERVQQRKQQFAVIANNNSGNQYPIKNSKSQLHVTAQQKYPAALPLPIPANIDPAETTRFSPNRARDITSTAITSHQANSLQYKVDITLDNSIQDPHIESYDCSGAVGLSAVMQSNVPTPFGGMHSFTHLNMPGGQWSQDSKFMSHNLQTSHYTNLRQQARADWSSYNENATVNKAE